MKRAHNLILASAISLTGVFLWPLGSIAQEKPSPDTLQTAQKMVSIMSPSLVAAATEQVTTQMWPVLEASIRNKNPNISPEAINAVRKEFQNLQNSFVTELLEDAPALYARHYTTEELRQLIAFYQSPVGAKSLKVTPLITADFAVAGAQRISSMEGRMRAAINAILRLYGYTP
jgi:hypothetical protein